MSAKATASVWCPHRGCRKKVKLTSRGNLFTHSRYSREHSGEYDTRCPASGKDPKTWKEPGR